MYIYYCTLIGISLLSICYAESTSNYAESSQSYNRGDVSLSYKYNVIHVPLYTTSKPHVHTKLSSEHNNLTSVDPHNHSRQINYRNVQFVPLPLRNTKMHPVQIIRLSDQEENEKTETNTEVSSSTYFYENNEKTDVEKEDHEQKRNVVPLDIANDAPRKYVPGYNVDLQSLKNKLLQNGLYANNPNFLVKNKQINVHLLQRQTTYQKQDNLKVVSQNKEARAKGAANLALNYQNMQDIEISNKKFLPKDEKSVKKPFFYVKAPTLELNLARAHQIPRAYYKASVNVKSNFRKLPSKPEEFFSHPKIKQPSKALLHHVLNKRVYMAHRDT